ncbi:MAG: hypothetical protein J6V56_05925, partial [Clostridia bacterium]|nr:hypothetical protein [Clostridia bacterium]
MNIKNVIRSVSAILLAAMMLVSIVACQDPEQPGNTSGTPEEDKTYTYNTYTTLSPSNWNELT